MQVMHAIISPRTLHELCRVALDALETADLEAAPTAELLTTLLIPGSLLSLRNLILGRCVHIALTLPRVAPQVVAMASTVSGQVGYSIHTVVNPKVRQMTRALHCANL